MEILVALEASELVILEMSTNRDSTTLRHSTMARAVAGILREFLATSEVCGLTTNLVPRLYFL